MGILQRDIMRAQLAIELAFTIDSELDQDELNAAVVRATDELSRFVPLKLIAELHFDRTVTDDSITGLDSTAVALANKPLRPTSETVTSDPAGTTYVRNDDYVMDYINGTLTVIPSGNIADSTALLVSYDRDGTLFDISTLLTRPIAITEVVYTILGVPQNHVGFDLHGDILELITGPDLTSQGTVGDDQNIRIFYEAYHTPPTDSAGGSYPSYLDEVIQLGMGGFALRSAVMDQRWLARSAIADAKTEYSLVQAVLTRAITEADLGNAALDAADAALLVMRGSAGEPYDDAISTLVLAKTALDKVTVELTTDMNDILDNAVLNIDIVRGSATEPYDAAIAQLITMIAELAEADTASDSLNALITAATNSINEGLELLPALITAMNADIDNVEDALETDTENANAYLAAGDAFLNLINTGGPTTPRDYVEYANAKITIAQTWVSGAAMRGRNIEMKVAEIQGRTALVQAVADEVTAKLGVVNGYNQVVSSYNNTANILIGETNARLGIAQGRRSLADGFIAEAAQRIAQAQGYINTATLAIQEAGTNVGIATQRLSQATVILGEADRNLAVADRIMIKAERNNEMGDKLQEEADRRIGEFRNTIRDKQQVTQGPRAIASRKQYQ